MNAPIFPQDFHQASIALSGPINLEIEQQVLGSILINNDVLAYVIPVLKPEHFSEELHQRVYSIALDLHGQQKPVTPLTILTYLGDKEIGPGISTRHYLARLAAEVASPVLAPGLAREIRDLAGRRQLITIGEALIATARDAHPTATCLDLVSTPLQDLQKVAEVVTEAETRRDAGESAAAVVKRVRAIMSGEKTDSGVSTGLPELDRAVGGGFQPGTLWIIAGRPRMGKSVLGTGFAQKVASRGARDIENGLPGYGAQYFSLELPEDQIIARILADLAYTPRHPVYFGEIMKGSLDEDGLWAIEEAQAKLARLPLALDVAPSLTITEITARVRAEKLRMARSGTRLAVVFIDYLKYIRASDRYRGNRVYEVGEISGSLKQLAKSENVCVVLLAQVNRAVDKTDRKDKAPNLSDLRDSGDLEADADVVLFIDRESVRVKQSAEYKAGNDEATARFIELQHKADLIIAKTRVGSENTLSIWFDAGASTFASEAQGGAA